MRKITTYLLCTLGEIILIMSAQAQNADSSAKALMTARDMQTSSISNITITNQAGQSVTAYGLFLASLDVNDCSVCTGSVIAGDNVAGALVSPVTFKANQVVPIGQNYLYNMIYNGLYYVKNNVGSAPCSLPGCSWPGDDINVRGWCVTINAVSLNSNYTSSTYTNGSHPPASTPAYAAAGNFSPFNYKYDLINPATLGNGNACLGPITCNDKTLTCSVSGAQNESFQPY